MVRRRVMFGEGISVIVLPLSLMDSKLSLVYSVLDPVERHVHCLGSLNLGSSIGEAVGGGIICGNASRSRLFFAHFLEYGPDMGGLLAVVEQGANLRLGGCRHKMSHDSTVDVDRAIGFVDIWGLILVAQVEITTNSGSGFGLA
jgi:hypothetical protein